LVAEFRSDAMSAFISARMHNVALLLTSFACLTCPSRGRRVQNLHVQLEGGADELLFYARCRQSSPPIMLKMLLLAFMPAAAYSPFGRGQRLCMGTCTANLLRRDTHPVVFPGIQESISARALLPRMSDRGELEEITNTSLQASPAHAATQLDKFFFDKAELFVRSGAGGEGAVGFRGEHAAGGTGGRGGNVYLECSSAVNTLSHLEGSSFAHAERGGDAFRRESGKKGVDKIVRVPPNTLVHERDTGIFIGKLTQPGEKMLVADGGEGGAGNGFRKNKFLTMPPGGTQKRWLVLSMTLVADVGLLGMPNAGKSTLLRTVSNARPEVADYPFTTLIPNLGVCDMERFGLGYTCKEMVWLDIPGVIEGAAEGKGLGLAFLRHADKCRLMLHLVDGTSEDPVARFHAINSELKSFSPKLGKMPQVVLLTKIDLPEVKETAQDKVAALKKAAGHGRVLAVSSHAQQNVGHLLKRMRSLVDQVDEKEARMVKSRSGAPEFMIPKPKTPQSRTVRFATNLQPNVPTVNLD